MYLSFSQKTITDFTPANIEKLYNDGFVFTRRGYGEMDQTRSVRVNLNKFELTSENRRVLRKNENIELKTVALPHPNYDWSIHKMGFEFYTKKFGNKTFSANKIKELLTNESKSNFNLLLEYCHCEGEGQLSLRARRSNLSSANEIASSATPPRNDKTMLGYAICFQTKNILHYCYPFYNLDAKLPNLGIAMMTKAIVFAKEQDKKYVYLGSAKDKTALYKFQFDGVEWFDGKKWDSDVTRLKTIL